MCNLPRSYLLVHPFLRILEAAISENLRFFGASRFEHAAAAWITQLRPALGLTNSERAEAALRVLGIADLIAGLFRRAEVR